MRFVFFFWLFLAKRVCLLAPPVRGLQNERNGMSKAREFSDTRQFTRPSIRMGVPYEEKQAYVDDRGRLVLSRRDANVMREVEIDVEPADVPRLIKWLQDTFLEPQ